MIDSLNINSINISIPTIIYIRSSTKKQNDITTNAASADTQSYTCVDYCKKNNFKIDFIKQETCSARNNNNQKELLKIIENYNNINLVLFDISRFSRNILDGIKMVETCFKNNITIYFVKENMKVKDKKDLPLFTTNLINAHNESDTISYRVTESIKYRKNIGTYIGNTKYGFTKIKKDGICEIIENEKEQLIIKIILKLKFGGLISDLDYLSIKLINKPLEKIYRDINTENKIFYGEYGNTSIAYLLNYNDIKYKGSYWKPSNISNIINNNIMEQDKIETILDDVFLEFSKLLITSEDRKTISNNILNKLSEINGYKIEENDKYNIINCKSILDIVNILNLHTVNFRIWSQSDIHKYITNYTEYIKKRTVSELLI
jgi:DNA invertase Pin-like site-specific DNA recombinase